MRPHDHAAIDGGDRNEAWDEAWDGSRFADEIARRAGCLAAAGIGRGARLLFLHGGTPGFLADLYAAWHLGASAACADPALTRRETEQLIALTQPAALVLSEAQPDVPGRGVPLVRPGAGGAAKAPPPAPTDPRDEALILFTSGSTGVPKAVAHSFGGIAARIALNLERMPAADLARSLCVLPTHFGHGLIGNCLTPLAAGGSLLLKCGAGLRMAAGLGPLIDAQNITFLSSVPSFWRLALRMSLPPSGGSLKRIHVGSAPLSAELWSAIVDWSGGAEVVNMYGLTETANWTAGASSREHAPQDGLVGAMWGGEARVRDATGALAPAGRGEIVLGSPSQMLGYVGRPPDPLLAHGWLATGDVGEIGDDGTIRLVGRTRTEINRAGVKVHPEEVELLLERHPDIAEACAFAAPDPAAGETVAVAIAPTAGRTPDLGQVQEWCAARLRREARPEIWHVLESIPKSDRGKMDRRATRDMCLGRSKK